MRIGIDVRAMSQNLTGIGRYCYELIDRLSQFQVDIVLFSPAPMINKQLSKNISICESNFTSRIGRIIWSQTFLPYWAYKYKIDIFWGTTHRLPELLSRKIYRVVTIHDMVWLKCPKTMRNLNLFMERLLMPRALKLADTIISVSASTANDIVSFNPGLQNKIRIVHLAPFSQSGNKNQIQTLDPNIIKPYILFVGTLEPRKNFKSLVEALSLVPYSIRNKYQLVISGGLGWGNIDIESIVKENKLEKNVLFTGYVTDAQLVELYKNAYFLAMPSLYEGFGLPIIEAHSHGIPVLTSNISSMPEVAGDAAIYVNPQDVGDISRGLKKMLENSDLRNDLANKAQKNALRFSWGNSAQRLFTIFKEAFDLRNSKLTK